MRRYSARANAVVSYLRKTGGLLDIGDLAVIIYGKDLPKYRTRVHHTLEELVQSGVLVRDGERLVSKESVN